MQVIHMPTRPIKPFDPREQAVVDPYPETPESIAAAEAYCLTERAKLEPRLLDEDEKLAAVEAVSLLLDRWGSRRVAAWVRNLSAMKGLEG